MEIFKKIEQQKKKMLEASAFESVSSLTNEVMGQCPKCKQAFSNASSNGVRVFYCENCRVAQPLPVG